jgi:hypothetical protein
MSFLRHGYIMLCVLAGQAFASAAEPRLGEKSEATAKVLSVVQRFFDALAARDPVACKATLAPEGQLQVLNETTDAALSFRLLGDFADRLPGMKQRPLERIWNPTVLVEGRIAIVWAPYDFHRDGKFSHSGTEVFTLMHAGGEWKIVSLAFTVQPGTPSQHPAGPPPK